MGIGRVAAKSHGAEDETAVTVVLTCCTATLAPEENRTWRLHKRIKEHYSYENISLTSVSESTSLSVLPEISKSLIRPPVDSQDVLCLTAVLVIHTLISQTVDQRPLKVYSGDGWALLVPRRSGTKKTDSDISLVASLISTAVKKSEIWSRF